MSDTTKVVFAAPTPLADDAATAAPELTAEMHQRELSEDRIERVLASYQQGDLSFAAAAEEASATRSELARQAYLRGIEPLYDPAMVAEEMGW